MVNEDFVPSVCTTFEEKDKSSNDKCILIGSEYSG